MARPRRYAAADVINITKRCSKCAESRLLTQFTKDSRASDGLACTCNPCCNERRRKRYKEDEEFRKQYYVRNTALRSRKIKSRTHYTCNTCGEKKPRDCFDSNQSTPSGLNVSRCKECYISKLCYRCGNRYPLSKFYKKDGDKASVYCKVCSNKQQKKWRTGNPKSALWVRKWHLKRKYNLSWEAFEALHSSQGGKCAICRKELSIMAKNTCVDHCHETGRVRGILCTCCNSGIGQFGDNLDLLEIAIKYLRDRRME